jgi:site-specific DNA-methyltransferase (adenine-specific)
MTNCLPHYSGDNVKLYLGDTIEILSTLPDGCIDLIYVDPPYFLSNGGFTCYGGKYAIVDKGEWDKSNGVEEDFKFHCRWIEACGRVLKPNGTMWVSGTYHSVYSCGYALQKNGWHIINDICWFKPNGMPNLSGRMFAASHETLLWVKKNKEAKHYFNYECVKKGTWSSDFIKRPGKQMKSVWGITPPKAEEKRYGTHPAQKPEALLDRIILICSQEGDTILDPFCGSGTMGVSALRHKRKFIGIDGDASYLDKLAIPRIKDTLTREIQCLF